MRIWRMRIACWIPKATDTQSEYVIFIVFPLQQWLQERVSMPVLFVICDTIKGDIQKMKRQENLNGTTQIACASCNCTHYMFSMI
jgi:hypothetical protein